MPGDLQLVVVRRHAGNESEHADDQESRGNNDRRTLHGHQFGSLRHVSPPSTSLLTGQQVKEVPARPHR
jgi:hypothetical protein